VVHALEHAIFASSSMSRQHGEWERERGKNHPTTYAMSMKRTKKREEISESLVTG
jgi:hypothetical protein